MGRVRVAQVIAHLVSHIAVFALLLYALNAIPDIILTQMYVLSVQTHARAASLTAQHAHP